MFWPSESRIWNPPLSPLYTTLRFSYWNSSWFGRNLPQEKTWKKNDRNMMLFEPDFRETKTDKYWNEFFKPSESTSRTPKSLRVAFTKFQPHSKIKNGDVLGTKLINEEKPNKNPFFWGCEGLQCVRKIETSEKYI